MKARLAATAAVPAAAVPAGTLAVSGAGAAPAAAAKTDSPNTAKLFIHSPERIGSGEKGSGRLDKSGRLFGKKRQLGRKLVELKVEMVVFYERTPNTPSFVSKGDPLAVRLKKKLDIAEKSVFSRNIFQLQQRIADGKNTPLAVRDRERKWQRAFV